MENGNGEEPDYVVLRGDRRKHLRKQLVVLKVVGTDARGTFFGYAKTLGRGGMYISSVNPRKVGTEFDLTFKLDDGGPEIKCRCVVVWQREYKPHDPEPGMGIKFLDIDEASRERIEKFVESK